MSLPVKDRSPIDQLIQVMARLRDPNGGCPWDIEQDFSTIAPYTIEEAYEVADAIDRGDMADLKEELGDLLLQVVFHSQMASETGTFTFDDVAAAISEKMIRRHPHVFGDANIKTADAQTSAWEVQKAAERAAKSSGSGVRESALDGVAGGLPSLMRAEKLQKRAARVGFDWPDHSRVLEKLDEEVGELSEAVENEDTRHIEEEMGDVLFVCANLARKLNVDPEEALRKANAKFTRRFHAMEDLARANGEAFSDLGLDAQEALWQSVKSSGSTDD